MKKQKKEPPTLLEAAKKLAAAIDANSGQVPPVKMADLTSTLQEAIEREEGLKPSPLENRKEGGTVYKIVGMEGERDVCGYKTRASAEADRDDLERILKKEFFVEAEKGVDELTGIAAEATDGE